MIAAATLRSLEYIKGLYRENLKIDKVFLLDDFGFQPGQRNIDKEGKMAHTIDEFCKMHGIEFSNFPSDVNSKGLEEVLLVDNASITIYSGYGGQIVKSPILNACNQLLHIHSGLLPEYRGSTTIYYAILNNDPCGATAILLDNNIDTGVIVGERQYKTPEPGADIDFKLDIEFRTDLLIDVILNYKNHGDFNSKITQLADEGRSYYVAHPVLRHIAILRGGQKKT